MTDFNIAEIVVTHTYHYEPDEYLAYCESNNEEPTEEGFILYLQPEIAEDFPNSSAHPLTVTYIKQ